MNAVQLSLDEALASRDEALDLLARKYPRFLDQARAVAESIAREKGWVTADDVREVLAIPSDVHPNAMGSLFRGPQWERVGWTKSAQPQRHGNRVGIWQLHSPIL